MHLAAVVAKVKVANLSITAYWIMLHLDHYIMQSISTVKTVHPHNLLDWMSVQTKWNQSAIW